MKISTRVALLLVAAMLTAPLARAQSDGFYRIRNVNEATNKDYVKMTSNVFNYTTIVGSASSTAKDPAPAIERAKKYFKFDVGLTTNVLSDPGTIFYLKKQSDNQYNLYCQGTDLYAISKGAHHGNNTGTVNIGGFYTTIAKQTDGSYVAYLDMTNLQVTVVILKYNINLGKFYFWDNGGKIDFNDSDSGAPTHWSLEPVNEANMDNFYFAAAPKE